MAKLTALPGLDIINGMKGKVDYYLWMGIPCARLWPRSPGHNRAPAVEAQWPAFAWVNSYWKHLPSVIRDAYTELAVSTNMTGRDLFTKSFINGDTLFLEEF